MPVFVIAEVEVTEPEAYARDFVPKNQPIVKAAGGRYVAVGGKVTPLEGPAPQRCVVHVWDTMDEMLAWWHSPELKASRAIGNKYAKFRVYAVEGLPTAEPTR